MLVFCGLAASCTGGSSQRPGGVRLSTIQRKVFDQTCSLPSCHLGPGPDHELNLTEGKAHGDLVNVPSRQKPEFLLVSPGNPDDSYLLRKMTGEGIIGERMPTGLPALPEEQVAMIREWIRSGASNN